MEDNDAIYRELEAQRLDLIRVMDQFETVVKLLHARGINPDLCRECELMLAITRRCVQKDVPVEELARLAALHVRLVTAAIAEYGGE